MKMMQLMVNRRQVPEKKTSSVNETLSDGLATFAMDRHESDFRKPQQILKHPPRRSYRHSEPDGLSSPRNEAVQRKDVEEADGECEDVEASRRRNTRRHRRAASLDTKQLENIRLGPTLKTSLSFKEHRGGDAVPEKLTADDSTGKFAYISLDGRLINAELATSVTSIGGRLGEEEAQAWEDFAPMQRVLIVAVSAAAAAAAKHRNRKEIDLLLKTVQNRENELDLLRQELSELCKQCRTNASQIHPEPLQLLETLRSSPPKTPAAQRESPATRFDGDGSKVKLDLQEAWSSTKPRRAEPELRGGERRLCREYSPVSKDVAFVESTSVTPCKGESFFSSDEAWAKEEAKWYVNPMVETAQDFYDISTPERTQSMYSVCNPAVQGSFEWTVLRSSFATRGTGHVPVVESPAPVQTTVSNWSSYQPRSQMGNEGALHKEHKAMRAVCAAVVLDLRERMLAVLDKEASMVMAALDNSVEDAKTQIASMHLGVASCWNASVPKALAALSLSPSEFDCYLNETQGTSSTWSDVSKIEESIAAWRQYLETNYGAKVPSEGVEGKPPNHICGVGERKVSMCRADEGLAHFNVFPCCSGQNEDNQTGSQNGGLVCPRNSAEELTEQLLGELDKAAAKVAVMERQMKKLEQDVAEGDGKPTCKLAGCVDRDLKNQVTGREDVAELVRQLQSKEVEVADLKKGHQNLKRKSKTRKIEDENILSPMATPRGYGTIYWERATGLKKTKFHAESGDPKTNSNILTKINEPKALLESKNKEIEELKEEHKSRDVELDKKLAAAETIKAASADKIAMLEDLCKQKDSTLSYLKQDLHFLESKVHGSRVYQFPAVPRARRNSTSSTPSSSSGYGTTQKQRFSEKYAPLPSGSDPIHEHIGRFRRDIPSNRGHYRNLPYINTQRHEELTDDGRSEQGYDQETSHEYNSSPPGSTIGDDCSVTSLAFSETEVESRLGSEYCSSGEDSRYRTSKDRLSGTKGTSYNRPLQKHKPALSDLRRAVTSTASSGHGLTRAPTNISTSATSASKPLSGEKHSTKTLNRTLSGEYKKVTKDPNSPRTSNLKAQRIAAINHRRSLSLDMNFKSTTCSILETSGLSGGSVDGCSLDSQETSAIKRKRWV